MSVLEFFIYITLINWSIVTFLWLFIKNNKHIFFLEAYWGLGFIFLSIFSMTMEGFVEDYEFNLRQYLANFLIILLGTNLFLLSLKKERLGLKGFFSSYIKDYKKSSESYKNIFLKMGLLQVIVISPIISVNYLPGPNGFNFLDFLGIFVFSIGFYIERKSNNDLIAFKIKETKKEEFLSIGLWGLSRHPNSFGHLLQWWALYILACNAIGGMWSFYGPLALTLYTFISIKGTEKRLVTNFAEYSQYIQNNNKLIPQLLIGESRYFKLVISMIPFKGLTRIMGFISGIENNFLKTVLIKFFCYLYKPNLEESAVTDLKDFKSFNSFFSRKLNSVSRPINPEKNIITSPVDGTVAQLGKIKKETLVQAKGINYEIIDLIEDQNLTDNFKNGFFVTIYLAPKNYHRIHFPFKGTIEKTKYLEGNLYSVNSHSTKRIKSLYTENERTFCYIKSGKFSYGIVSVGAAMVGSIVPFWNKEIKPKRRDLINLWNKGPNEDSKAINKGQELGYFQMGSTVILLLPSGIEVDKNFLYESKAVKFGEELINLSKK